LRRLCETENRQYCAKVERKSVSKQEEIIARVTLEEDLERWRQDQKKDPSISIMILGKETDIRPPHSEIAVLDISAQIYWSYWDALIIRNGVLYKKWVAPNLETNIFSISCISPSCERNSGEGSRFIDRRSLWCEQNSRENSETILLGHM